MPRLPAVHIGMNDAVAVSTPAFGCVGFGIPVRVEDSAGNDLGSIYIFGDISELDYTAFIKPFGIGEHMTRDEDTGIYSSSYDGPLIEATMRVGAYSDYGWDNSGLYAVVYTRYSEGGFLVLDSVYY